MLAIIINLAYNNKINTYKLSLQTSRVLNQISEIETLWDNFDIQKLDGHSEIWKNATVNHDEANPGRQYPGLPSNPGDTNELPSPISPPPQPILPPLKPPPGCQGPRGQYPSPKSCANYLNCWDDVVIEQTCPDGLLFNDAAGYCDFAFNVNCGDRPPATPSEWSIIRSWFPNNCQFDRLSIAILSIRSVFLRVELFAKNKKKTSKITSISFWRNNNL